MSKDETKILLIEVREEDIGNINIPFLIHSQYAQSRSPEIRAIFQQIKDLWKQLDKLRDE